MDRVIDICGGAPKGTGLQNLRECIIETKWKYDVAPEDKQVVWKRMILKAKKSGADAVKFQIWDPKFLKSGDWDLDGRRKIYEKVRVLST